MLRPKVVIGRFLLEPMPVNFPRTRATEGAHDRWPEHPIRVPQGRPGPGISQRPTPTRNSRGPESVPLLTLLLRKIK
jgi:hypothetical protein